MRKFYFLLLTVLFAATISNSQVSIYSFAASSGTYTALGSPTNVFPSGWDDNTPVSVPIGFTFTFNGTAYTTVFVHPNGYISFGSSIGTVYTPISTTTATNGIISAWGRDLQAQNTAPLGSVDYQTSGSVFTVQWSNTRRYNSTTVNAERFEMQIQLEQTTNVIRIVYGTWSNAVSALSTSNGEVGLRGTTNADFKNLEVLSAGNWATPAAGAVNTATCYYNEGTVATKPALGQTYTFSPPAPCVTPSAQPTLLSLTPGVNSISGTFTAASGSPSGYMVVRTATSTPPSAPVDGVVYTPGTSALGGVIVANTASTSFVSTGLSALTTYYYWIYSYNNLCVGAPFYRTASPLSGNSTTTACVISGTRTVGPTGNYASLTAALADLNTNGLAGPVVLELQSTYLSGVETFPITVPSLPCVSAVNTLTIRPQAGAVGLSITSANTTGTINFDGGGYVTIDGRAGGAGPSQLTISNTSTSGYAVQLINSATFNTIKYCTVAGVNTGTTSGVIFFNNATGFATGNSNNTIDNCDIRDGATTPTNLIYCSGNTTDNISSNNNNTISNSNIHDWFNASSTTLSGGINIVGGASDWTITGNSFYQSVSRTFTMTSATDQCAIAITTTVGNNFTVTNNFIGGSAPLCAGAAWTYTGGATGTPTPRFIRISTAVGAFSNISGNTIRNIAITSSSTSTAHSLIAHLNGNININNNTLGSQSATGNITFVLASTSTAPFFLPIGFGTGASPAVINVTNNNIGGISVSTSSTGAVSFRVIYGQPVVGSQVTITGNTVGGTVANSIQQATGTATAGVGSLFGILMLNPSVGNVITNNIVRNLTITNTLAGPSLTGINVQASGGGHTITGNSIFNLTTSGTNIATNNAASIVGLTMTGTAIGGGNISGNTIYNLTNSNATVAGWINGISIASALAPTTIVSKNFIHSINLASATGGMAGIISLSTGQFHVINNMIRLGYDAAGASITTPLQINGLYKANTGMIAFNNTVYIGGTGVASGTVNTYAFRRSSSGTADSVMNNIFYNARSNASGTGKHYAMFTNAATALFSNYNDLLANGTGGVLGINVATDYATLAAWRTATNQDWNSVSGDPVLVNPTGTSATVDLHIGAGATPIEQAGYNLAQVTDDYDAQARAGLTPVDIGADAGNFTLSDIAPPVIYLTPLLTNICSTGDRTLTGINITDATGVPTVGALRPRIYYRKGAGSWFSQPGTLTSGTGTNGLWSFTIVAADMGGLAAADVVSYYIIAQDIVATPNIASNFGGAVATDVNTVTTHPTTPNTFTIIATSLSGSYNVGVGQTYTTLTAAVAAYNSACLTGPVTFLLTDASYSASETFPITINANAFASAVNTLTIKPTLPATTITGSSASGLIVFNGADWVTINGSISATNNTICPPVTASRDLTITNTNTGTSSAVIWLQSTASLDGATNNSIRNLNIAGNGNTQTLIGVGAGSTTISTSSLGTGNHNNSYINNNISKTQYGIYTQGNSLGFKNNGTVINQNLINTVAPNNTARGGVVVGFENNISISGNNISEIAFTSSPDVFGIACGSISISSSTFTGNEVTNATITKNIIGSVRNTGTFSACGIFIATAISGTNLISNNMLSGVSANATSGDISVGILIGGGLGSITQVYNNTVTMTSVPANTGASDKSYALMVGGANPVVDVRNNIFVNTQNNGTGNNYAVVYGYIPFSNLTSDHNDYYVSAGATFFVGGTGSTSAPVNQTTIANLQSVTAKDGFAQNVLPVFVSATDLHLSNAAGNNWCLNGAGVSIGAVTDDIDCQARNNPPDIGADEFVATSTAAATPASQTVCSGVAITTIALSGATTFNWTRDNTGSVTGIAASGSGNISGTLTNTTNAPVTVTFTITPLDASGCAAPATLTATVTVNPTPDAVATPSSQTICSGATITTIAITGGVSGTTFNWTRDNTGSVTGIAASGAGDISGALTNTTSAPVTVTFTITPTTNGCPGTPITATVVVNDPLLITGNPSNISVCSGTPVTFTVTATGTPAPTYQWQVDNGGGFVNIGGANSSSYSFTATNAENGYQYQCIVTNACGSATSTAATLTVSAAASATISYAGDPYCSNAGIVPVTLTGTAGGTFSSTPGLSINPATGAVNTGTSTPGTYTVSYDIAASGSCPAFSTTTQITINLTPTVDPVSDQTVCNGSSTAPVTFTGNVVGATYNWTNTNPGIGLAASGSGNIPSFVGTNATNAPISGTITVTPSYTYPGSLTAQTFNYTGAMQTWTVPAGVTSVFVQTWGGQGGSGALGGASVSGGSGGLGGYAEGNLAVTPGQVLNIFVGGQGATPLGGFNGGGNGGSVNAGGGGGASDVRVGGVTPADRVITAGGGGGGGRGGCDQGAAATGGIGGNGGSGGGGVGQNGNDSPTSGGVAGGGFGGNFASVQGALGAAGIGCAGFLGSPGVATATETGGNGGSGQACCCFTSNSIPGGGGGGGGQIGGGGAGGGSAGTTGCSGNSKGAGGGGGGGSSYTGGVTAGATNSGIWLGNGMVSISYATSVICTGTPTTFTITVNPTPTVNAVSNQTACNGGSTSAVNFSGAVAGTVYNWTNSDPSIGLAASGSGNIPSFVATNATNAPVTATITVTPSYTNNSVTCTGTPTTFTITVNPTATVDPVSNQTVCNGSPTTAVNFSSPTTGGTIVYNWTNSNPAIGLAASGSGNIPSFVGTNATNAPITGTITVTPTYTNGVSCVGTPTTFTITVNPIPNAVIVGTPGSIQVIITGNGSWADEITWTLRNSLNAVILSGGPYGFNPPATPSAIVPATNAPFTFFIEAQGTFNDNACTWEVRCNGNVVASGCIRGTNNGTACGSVGTLTVSNISGCSNNPSPQTVCSGSPIIPIPFTSNVAGTVFNWTRDNQVNVTGLPNSGTGTITGIPINNTNVAQTVLFTITPSYTNNGVTCTGTPITATVIVNKAPTITCPANITVNSQPGLCGAAVLFPAATATGAPAPVITYSHFSGAVFPVGTTTVTATATNICGVATCTFTITVIDVEPPVITCPAPIVVSNDPNQCGAVVNYSVGVVDNCQKFQVPVTILPHGGGALTVAGNNLPGGFYFDLTNNSATPKTIKSLMVRFGSNAFGAVSSPAPVSVYVTTSATTYVGNTNTAGAWTAIGTNIPVTVGGPNSEFSLVPLPGNGFTLAPGATKGVYLMGTAASLVYNSAANSSFTPISNGVLTVTPGQASSALFVGAGSPRTPNVIINYITLTQTAGLPSGSFFPIGTTTNTFIATDDAGNTSASCSFTVRVNDTQAPTITCPGNITVTTPVGSCTAVVNYTVTASDNCPGVTTQLIAGLASGSAFPIGTTTVTWRATDAAGNLSAPCSFTVTVIDAQLPVISQQPVSVSVCAGENASFSVTSSNAVSYQWQLFDGNNWNNIPGATGSTLTLPNVTIGMNAGAYRVRVIGLCTTVNSNPATLTVKPLPTIVLTASRPPILLPGQSLTITAVVNPGGGTFVWRKNGNVIAGATTDQLTGLTVDDAGSYTCTYTLNGCSATSAVMVVSAQQSGNIYVYPNPNYGQFEVRFYNQTNEAVTLTVYNVLGQVIYQKAFGTGLPYSHMDVNLGSVSQGSYLVAVVNGAGQIIGAEWIIVYKY